MIILRKPDIHCICLREFTETHPKEVLAFAAKYGYISLFKPLSKVPALLDTPLPELALILPPRHFVLWVSEAMIQLDTEVANRSPYD